MKLNLSPMRLGINFGLAAILTLGVMVKNLEKLPVDIFVRMGIFTVLTLIVFVFFVLIDVLFLSKSK